MADIKTEVDGLGDCLLHRTHHAMTRECWEVVIDHYMQVADRPETGAADVADLQAEAVNSYKTTYERALLNAIRNEAAHA